MSACNCKVNQQISYLHKKYGNKIPVSKESKIRFTIKEKLKHFLIYIIEILFLPVMFLYVFYVAIFSKKKQISIKKLLNVSV